MILTGTMSELVSFFLFSLGVCECFPCVLPGYLSIFFLECVKNWIYEGTLCNFFLLKFAMICCCVLCA